MVFCSIYISMVSVCCTHSNVLVVCQVFERLPWNGVETWLHETWEWLYLCWYMDWGLIMQAVGLAVVLSFIRMILNSLLFKVCVKYITCDIHKRGVCIPREHVVMDRGFSAILCERVVIATAHSFHYQDCWFARPSFSFSGKSTKSLGLCTLKLWWVNFSFPLFCYNYEDVRPQLVIATAYSSHSQRI